MALYCKGEQVTPTQAGFTRAAGLSMPRVDPDGMTVMYFTYNVTARSGLYNTWYTHGRSGFGSGHYLVTFSSPINISDEYAVGYDGADTFSSVPLITGRWQCHGLTTRTITAGSNHPTFFYWDLPDLSKKVGGTRINDITNTSDTRIQIGGTPWTTSEGTDSYICGLKIWECWMPDAALARESVSFYPVLPQYFPHVWAVVPGHIRQGTSGLIVPDVWKYGRHFTIYDGANAVTTVSDAPRIHTPSHWLRNHYALDAAALAASSATSNAMLLKRYLA